MRRGSLYYLDSSAVVKLIFEEKESKTLREFLKQNLVSSDLTKIEVYRVCARLDKKSIEVCQTETNQHHVQSSARIIY